MAQSVRERSRGGTLVLMETTVRKHAGPERFELTVDGAAAGFAQFVDLDEHRIFYHTEVFPEFSGQGLAATIVDHALHETRAEGLRIVAVCPYVKKYVNTHDEWADAVDPVTPSMLRAIPRS
jgi:hypothetical protein